MYFRGNPIEFNIKYDTIADGLGGLFCVYFSLLVLKINKPQI